MYSLGSLWLVAVTLVSLPSLLAPWPLLGFLGGLIRFFGYLLAGPLFAFHGLLLLLYAGLFWLGLVPFGQLRAPTALSAVTMSSIAIPALLTMVLSSPQWTLENGTLVSDPFHHLNAINVSFTQWINPLLSSCPRLDRLEKIATIYNETIPPFGPHTRHPSFFGPTVQLGLQVPRVGTNIPKTNLSTFYFPLPVPHSGEEEESLLQRIAPGIVIFVHGGGWWTGSPLEFTIACKARTAHDNGWDFAAVEYRLGRDGWSGELQKEDVMAAIRHIRVRHGHASSKVIVWGSSAGAHLALLASYQLCNEAKGTRVVDAVVANAPSTSVKLGTSEDSISKWVGAWSEAQAHDRLCQGVKDCDQKLSPLHQVSQYTPKTILVHSGSDEFFPPQHSRTLAKRLHQRGIPNIYMELPLQPHLIGIVPNSVPNQMLLSTVGTLMRSLG